MTKSESSESNFLKDALVNYAQYTSAQKQDVQKSALKWLQSHINSDLTDKTILDQFAQKWRKNSNQPLSVDPLYLENLPRSYKGDKSLNNHQEEALIFLQDIVPLQMQEGFKQRWELKAKLQVSNSDGATFKTDQQIDVDSDGSTWCQVEDKTVYYLLSHEEKGDDYLVELSEEISPQNQNTWFVAKEHVKISSI
ncbi:hypothetical protein [Vacuolonema iberomarrocanum]|uniref:hypothetical protein n=1 Tax=Vacuolonema iberomarrocanum TaxID=3454632 RepID=UPI0019E4B9A6|nr:hypothetical protein [filamentous cyanobacterium LEGE 07170]